MRTMKDIIDEVEADGVITESLSFENIIKMIDEEDPDSAETMTDLPALPKLLKQVHKQGFWAGAEFGRLVFLKILEDEDKMNLINKETEDDKQKKQTETKKDDRTIYHFDDEESDNSRAPSKR